MDNVGNEIFRRYNNNVTGKTRSPPDFRVKLFLYILYEGT